MFVNDQTHRWIEAGVFEDIVDDVRELLRVALGKETKPAAAILDSRTLRSTPETGRQGFAVSSEIMRDFLKP